MIRENSKYKTQDTKHFISEVRIDLLYQIMIIIPNNDIYLTEKKTF